MQNTVQARRKSNRVSAHRQAHRRPIPSFKPATCDQGGAIDISSDGYCLGLYSGADDSGFVAGVHISAEQFQALQRAASQAGKPLSELLAHACDLIVSNRPAQLTTEQLHGFVKMEESISAAGTVLVLLAEKIADYRQQLGINDDDDGLTSGTLNLAEQTGAKLKADFQTALDGLRKLNSEVKP